MMGAKVLEARCYLYIATQLPGDLTLRRFQVLLQDLFELGGAVLEDLGQPGPGQLTSFSFFWVQPFKHKGWLLGAKRIVKE